MALERLLWEGLEAVWKQSPLTFQSRAPNETWKDDYYFGADCTGLGIWLVSWHTDSQDGIAGISVSALMLWVIMSQLKIIAMKRLDFLQ